MLPCYARINYYYIIFKYVYVCIIYMYIINNKRNRSFHQYYSLNKAIRRVNNDYYYFFHKKK